MCMCVRVCVYVFDCMCVLRISELVGVLMGVYVLCG